MEEKYFIEDKRHMLLLVNVAILFMFPFEYQIFIPEFKQGLAISVIWCLPSFAASYSNVYTEL